MTVTGGQEVDVKLRVILKSIQLGKTTTPSLEARSLTSFLVHLTRPFDILPCFPISCAQPFSEIDSIVWGETRADCEVYFFSKYHWMILCSRFISR